MNLAPLNYPFDDLTIGAFGNIILFATGVAASFALTPDARDEKGTFWHWRKERRLRMARALSEIVER